MAARPPDARLPAHGVDADQVLAQMAELRADDRDWRGGRVFSLVYTAGDDVLRLLQRAANLYSAENALNTMVFPSLGRMQHDIVTITAGLLGADRLPAGGTPDVRGFLTSGGTESLLQATKTARDRGRAVLNYLGMDGYLALAEDAHRAGRALMTTIEATPGLALRDTPDATVCAFGGDPLPADPTPSPSAMPWQLVADGSSTASPLPTACTPPCTPDTPRSSTRWLPT
jgi:glutamate/tyrosine decarboxylase-like PLP-dependent enzyme